MGVYTGFKREQKFVPDRLATLIFSNMNKMHNEVYGAMVQCEVVSKEHLPDYKTDYGN